MSSFSPYTTLTHIHSSFLDEDPLYYHPTTRTFTHAAVCSSCSTISSSLDDASYYEYDLNSDDGEVHAVHGNCFAAISDHRLEHEENFNNHGSSTASDCSHHQPTPTSQRLPDYFRCPISRDRMRDPVTDADGHSYERQNIVYWLAWHETSPLTRRPMTRAELRPNRALRCAIDAWFATAAAAKNGKQERIATKTRKDANRTTDALIGQAARQIETSSPARATVQLTNLPLLGGQQQARKEPCSESAYA